MYMGYSIGAWSNGDFVRVRLTAILAEYHRIDKDVPDYLTRLMRDGCRYSYEDFDTLSAAMRELYAVDKDVWRRLGTLEKS